MPGPDLMREAGFSPEAVAERANDLLSAWRAEVPADARDGVEKLAWQEQ
jgi:hypothetical protein